jgi:hypothetical protein
MAGPLRLEPLQHIAIDPQVDRGFAARGITTRVLSQNSGPVKAPARRRGFRFLHIRAFLEVHRESISSYLFTLVIHPPSADGRAHQKDIVRCAGDIVVVGQFLQRSALRANPKGRAERGVPEI